MQTLTEFDLTNPEILDVLGTADLNPESCRYSYENNLHPLGPNFFNTSHLKEAFKHLIAIDKSGHPEYFMNPHEGLPSPWQPKLTTPGLCSSLRGSEEKELEQRSDDQIIVYFNNLRFVIPETQEDKDWLKPMQETFFPTIKDLTGDTKIECYYDADKSKVCLPEFSSSRNDPYQVFARMLDCSLSAFACFVNFNGIKIKSSSDYGSSSYKKYGPDKTHWHGSLGSFLKFAKGLESAVQQTMEKHAQNKKTSWGSINYPGSIRTIHSELGALVMQWYTPSYKTPLYHSHIQQRSVTSPSTLVLSKKATELLYQELSR